MHYEAGGDSVELSSQDFHEAQAETWNQTDSILLGYHLHRLLLSARPSEKISQASRARLLPDRRVS